MSSKYFTFLLSLSICFPLILSASDEDLRSYRHSPKLISTKIQHADDPTLNKLDEALAKVTAIYMQALFSGTHTPELEHNMHKLELELFDLLDALFKQQRLREYIKYESEVTRQMTIYNLLKKAFGYDYEENEKNT